MAEGRGFWRGRVDGDGLVTEIYHYLYSVRNDVRNLTFPDTVLFERGWPKVWFSWELRRGTRELKRYLGSDINEEKILHRYVPDKGAPHTIVAEYSTYTYDAAQQKYLFKFEYFDAQRLRSFLSGRATGVTGVLQRFIYPRSMENHALQVVWSPHATFISMCRNRHALHSSVPIEDKCVTFDGQGNQSTWVPVTPFMFNRCQTACLELSAIMSTTEGLNLKGFVALFKVDRDGNLNLTRCTSIRVHQPLLPTRTPVNMALLFADVKKGREVFSVLLPCSDALGEQSHADGHRQRHRSACPPRLSRSAAADCSPRHASRAFESNSIVGRGSSFLNRPSKRKPRSDPKWFGCLHIDLDAVASHDLDMVQNSMSEIVSRTVQTQFGGRGTPLASNAIVVAPPTSKTPLFLLRKQSAAPYDDGAGADMRPRKSRSAQVTPQEQFYLSDGFDDGFDLDVMDGYETMAQLEENVKVREQRILASMETYFRGTAMPSDLLSSDRTILAEFIRDACYLGANQRGPEAEHTPTHTVHSLKDFDSAPHGFRNTMSRISDAREKFHFEMPSEIRGILRNRADEFQQLLGLDRELVDVQNPNKSISRVEVLSFKAPRIITNPEIVAIVLKLIPPMGAHSLGGLKATIAAVGAFKTPIASPRTSPQSAALEPGSTSLTMDPEPEAKPVHHVVTVQAPELVPVPPTALQRGTKWVRPDAPTKDAYVSKAFRGRTTRPRTQFTTSWHLVSAFPDTPPKLPNVDPFKALRRRRGLSIGSALRDVPAPKHVAQQHRMSDTRKGVAALTENPAMQFWTQS